MLGNATQHGSLCWNDPRRTTNLDGQSSTTRHMTIVFESVALRGLSMLAAGVVVEENDDER